MLIIRQPLAFRPYYLIELSNGPPSTQLLIRVEMWMNLFLWDRMKIEYAKQSANQLSGELVSFVFNRVMEQASKERVTTDTTENLRNEKEYVTDV